MWQLQDLLRNYKSRRELIEHIENYYGCQERIYIVGSYLLGWATEASDIDILLIRKPYKQPPKFKGTKIEVHFRDKDITKNYYKKHNLPAYCIKTEEFIPGDSDLKSYFKLKYNDII